MFYILTLFSFAGVLHSSKHQQNIFNVLCSNSSIYYVNAVTGVTWTALPSYTLALILLHDAMQCLSSSSILYLMCSSVWCTAHRVAFVTIFFYIYIFIRTSALCGKDVNRATCGLCVCAMPHHYFIANACIIYSCILCSALRDERANMKLLFPVQKLNEFYILIFTALHSFTCLCVCAFL